MNPRVEQPSASLAERMIWADACLRNPELFRPDTKRPSWLPREIVREYPGQFFYRGPGCRIVPVTEPGLWLPYSCAVAFLEAADDASTTSNNATTGGFDTTGATLLVVTVSYYAPSGTPTVSDSKGNTWTPLTNRAGFDSGSLRLYYAANPTVGSAHTFTVATTAGYPAIIAAAFSGVITTSPFDQENANLAGSSVAVLDTNSLTPSENNCLVIAHLQNASNSGNAVSITGGFTIPSSGSVPANTGFSFGAALAYLIQTTASAANPEFSQTGGDFRAAAIASFKSTDGGGGGGSKLLLRLQGEGLFVGRKH